jgi:hypothetical protein
LIVHRAETYEKAAAEFPSDGFPITGLSESLVRIPAA